MKFVDTFAHRALVVLGYTVQGATLVNEIGMEALQIGVPLPSWARLAIPAAGIVATRLARVLPTDRLEPTPGLSVDDGGAALGRASGLAAREASKSTERPENE